jgi:hypothetical protein
MGLFILTDSNVLAQSEDLVNMVFERDMTLDVDASDIETDFINKIIWLK